MNIRIASHHTIEFLILKNKNFDAVLKQYDGLAKKKKKNLYFESQTKLQEKMQKTLTLFLYGQLGISTFSKQSFGKTPFWISSMAANIEGKQTLAASFRSVSQLAPCFWKKDEHRKIIDAWQIGKKKRG